MLVAKTGMQPEYAAAMTYLSPKVLVLTGVQTLADLEQRVPADCTGIVSLGLCGALSDAARIGQAFIYSSIATPDGTYSTDLKWRQRLFAATHYYTGHCWSSGLFNTANTPAQRDAIYMKTGCPLIDDESIFVAQFAAKRGIPCMGLRVVSDGTGSKLPDVVKTALNSNGDVNIWNIIEGLALDPQELALFPQMIREYEISMGGLRRAMIDAGPTLQAT